MIPVFIALAGVVLYVTYKTRRVPVPHTHWKRFHGRGTVPLKPAVCSALQGIYVFDQGGDCFGKTAILKWSYTVQEEKTLYHLSFFCEQDGAYMVCEGREDGEAILLSGFWRKLSAGVAGTVRLIVSSKDALSENPKAWVIRGWYGEREERPGKTVSLVYQRSIPAKKPLDILAHRGGARNVDFLPVSENSLEMMRMAARLGANGVEIDVRLTKDKVPVIIHDSFLSIHTIQDSLFAGLVSHYTLAELKEKELRKGGQVPTLEEALHTILYQTPLELVWLDIKKECDLRMIRNLQLDFLQRAKALGRDLRILIGIPDKMILECFKNLDDHLQLPSLTELGPQIAEAINADVWAPQYTGGFQKEEVERIQSQGKKAWVWSLDNVNMIQWYVKEGGFDGIVTNAPPVVFHTYYVTEETSEEKAD
ncbi:MAG: glycerophosphodiester phosphodiesterase [Flavisolibacter sp.]